MQLKFTFLSFLLLTSMCASAQMVTDTIARSPYPLPGVFNYVDQMPSTDYNIKIYLSENTHYPDSARVHNIEGRVVVKFVVDENGNVTDAKIIKSINKYLDDEALRVVNSMPRWKPGKQNGKPVKVYFTLPIAFKLQ